MILVVVYVGAVAVLFLFVVMMLDVDFVELREGFLNYLPVGARSAWCFSPSLLIVLGGWVFAPDGVTGTGRANPGAGEPTPPRSASSSTRATSSISRRPAWCCSSP